MQAAYDIASPPGGARPLKSIALRANCLMLERSPLPTTADGKLGGLGFGKRAPTPAVGGSSLPFGRSHQASKVGMEKLQVMELSFAQISKRIGSSSIEEISNVQETVSFVSFVSGSYHSSGHGAHSHIDVRDISSGSNCSESSSVRSHQAS